ncbi:hypothetical protein [Kitasatospora sp. NPDC090091]|uniref:hypothetical protein n=1 Tax=Kitasatospora sp. NPDC090091 TaxID=3364081 RepID=UPI0037F47CDE
MFDQLHPTTPTILAALHAAGLTATVEPADGGGYQIHLPGPYDTFALIGCEEVLPSAGEELTALHSQLQSAADGDCLAVVFHRCSDPACMHAGCGEGAVLDPAPLVAALADAINGRRPAFIPNGSDFFNHEGIRYGAYFDPAEHAVTITRDVRAGVSGPFGEAPAMTFGEAEDVLRGLGYAPVTEWAGPTVDGSFYCYLLRPGQ